MTPKDSRNRKRNCNNAPIATTKSPIGSSRRETLALLTVGACSFTYGFALPRTASAQSSPFTVGVKTLSFSSTNPKPGETVAITITVTTSGRGRRSVPWEILVNNRRIASGVQRNVAAGSSFTVRRSWKAIPGLHNFLVKADPQNTFKEAGRGLYDNAKGRSIRIDAATASGNRPSSRMTRQAQGNQRTKTVEPYTVKVSSFTATPSSPKYYHNTNLRLRFQAMGAGKKSVEWVIKRGNETIASGTQHNVQAGQTYTINRSWRAEVGGHSFSARLDPNNKLGETSGARSDNTRQLQVSVPPPDWSGWGTAALDGAVQGVRLWQAQARFTDIKVHAVSAVGAPGVLKGPSIKNAIKNKMKSEGCPDPIADKFATAVANAWKNWQDRVTIPGLPWYPAFAAWPGPQAPLTPNLPAPLASLPSAGATGLTVNALKASINSKLGSFKNLPGAQPAITAFANQFAARFGVWLATQQVQMVRGKGPVPTFAPPYVPVGPVVSGSASSAPGAALSSKPF